MPTTLGGIVSAQGISQQGYAYPEGSTGHRRRETRRLLPSLSGSEVGSLMYGARLLKPSSPVGRHLATTIATRAVARHRKTQAMTP